MFDSNLGSKNKASVLPFFTMQNWFCWLHSNRRTPRVSSPPASHEIAFTLFFQSMGKLTLQVAARSLSALHCGMFAVCTLLALVFLAAKTGGGGGVNDIFLQDYR